MKEIAEFVLACVMEKVVSSVVFVFAEYKRTQLDSNRSLEKVASKWDDAWI